MDWVLVGGGHAHVQVIRRFAMRPVPGVRLCVVLDRAEAVYSGMVPGWVAGEYRDDELEIDVVPLARRAGARVILAAATRIDPHARRIELEGRPAVTYDIASLDVGSSVRGLDAPGVREHALSTRPIRGLLDRAGASIEAARRSAGASPLRVLVVGGGAAGVELAMTLRARLAREGVRFGIELLGDAPRPLPGASQRVAARVLRELERAGITWRGEQRVSSVEKDAVVVDGERRGCDLAVWATGAAPQPLLDASSLPRDDRGFIRVRETLQVVGFDDLFAVGDCAALEALPWIPKAGVYAVRQGPILDANLRALVAGGGLRPYRPQRDFLALLNLGDGRALGHKWGMTVAGRWVWRWKDRIDRRFVQRFRVLGPDGAPAPEFPAVDSMAAEDMECGGCAAKLAAPRLDAALARLAPAPGDPTVRMGLSLPDDAAAWTQDGGDLVLGSLDAFRAFTDDPWLVGRVAAVNAASDLYAVGGIPRHALALVAIPDEDGARAEETLYQVLSGVRAALDPLGVSLVGGHTTRGQELQVGLSITGHLPERAAAPLTLGGLRAGDVLVLSKALGSGVLLAADRQGRLPGRWLRPLHAALLRANAEASRVARRCGASAATDVSGFGLARHLHEMLRAGDVAARVWLDDLPALPGALTCLAAGLRSTFHDQNAIDAGDLAVASGAREAPAFALLQDPQTSGGLLFGVAESRAQAVLEALRAAGDPDASVIGCVEAAASGAPRLRIEPGAARSRRG